MLVADQSDRDFEPPGDLVNLVLHRTGVGIDEDVEGLGWCIAHARALPPSVIPAKAGI